jgi:hypothetical protein
VSGEALDFTASPAFLEIVLARDPGRVAVAVRDDRGNPVTAAIVAMWPKKRLAAQLSGGLRTSAPGVTGMQAAPGEYYIAAFEEVEASALGAYDYFAQFNAKAGQVTISAGGTVTAESPLITKAVAAAALAGTP